MPFLSFGLHADLVRGVADLGFTQPSPIQKDAIPAGIAGRDVLACSATGSGKTAAFGLPILHRLIGKTRGVTRALIVTPTRELAAQIDEHLKELGRHTQIRSAAVYGGVGMGAQRQAFERGVDIIIATPGRLLDHLSYKYAKLNTVEMLVLDEADRMLDMGFLPDIRRILQLLPEKKQTLFFSATLPSQIGSLTRELLKNPLTINVERQAKPAAGITQTVYPVPHSLKSALLLKLVQGGNMTNALVFTRTKRRADRVADFLKKNGVSSTRIHGDRTQAQRTQALDGFKRGRYQVLVATDVAARGIDIDALSHVINFDLPGTSEDYIHRVGRTARAEAKGDALTFVAPDEERDLKAIERAVSCAIQRVILPDFDYKSVDTANSMGGGGGGGGTYGGHSGNRNQRPSGNRPQRRDDRHTTRSESREGGPPPRASGARPWENRQWKSRTPSVSRRTN